MAEQPQRIKAIETLYAGCRFRSRLESRWAVFFDTLGIAWQYEPEGFVVDGKPYLPDFYLPNLKRWIEVKGSIETLDVTLLKRFAFEANTTVMLLGPIPSPVVTVPNWLSLMGWPELLEYPEPEGGPLTWDRCVMVDREFFNDRGRTSFEAGGAPGKGEPLTEWITPKVTGWTRVQRLTDRAYTAARSARFEHGERGR
jgi:hypothetical protein